MSTTPTLPDSIADDVPDTERHAREHAPTDREFELLLEGARAIDDYRSLEAQFVIFGCGRLGLRAGELSHIHEEWVDWREGRIEIPSHRDCSCGYCVQKAEQKARVRNVNALDERYAACDEESVPEPGRSVGRLQLAEAADLLPTMWSPKTEASERSVPYDWSVRCEMILERMFDREFEWPHSRQVVNRRVTLAAEHAPGIDPDAIFPHALRSAAATHHAGRGLSVLPLQSMFGWSQLSTAELYLAENAQNTQRALRSVHSR